jgi:hypothetical protein
MHSAKRAPLQPSLGQTPGEVQTQTSALKARFSEFFGGVEHE